MHAVIIIGTGFGGISAAINLRKSGITDFVMLERRAFAGGTWLQNTYPGAAVDVQSPLYSLSGHPYPWSHLFAKQNELADYTKLLLNQYELHKLIRLNTTVREATWVDDSWQVSLQDGSCLRAKIVINATGPLSTPIAPKFPGIEKFKGSHFHSNDWQHNVDLTNKTVVIIGSGASAVQIIPAIVDKVKHLHVVQRTPHWILPRPDWIIPPSLRSLFAFRPIYALMRYFIYWMLELRVIAFKYSKRLLSLVGKKPALKHLRKQVSCPKLRQQLTPSFIIGCKRILVSNTYYPALQKTNCTLHNATDHITEFTENGLVFEQSGNIQADIVVFATGYNAIDALVSYRVVGTNQQTLAAQWKEYPRAYLGTSMPNFPNFFVVTGPNTGIGHTSAIFIIESQMRYILRCVQEVLVNKALSIEPTEFAEEQYTNMVHTQMAKTVWSYGKCTSWYQNAQGKVIAMFPGFSFTYRRLCSRFISNHHIIKR